MHSSILVKQKSNVSPFRLHMRSSTICTHEVGTSLTNWIIFTKDDKQFYKDENEVYHYKNHTFQIKDDWFIYDKLKIQLPQRTEISTFHRVALSLGLGISTEDNDPRLDIKSISFRELMYTFTLLSLKDLSVISNRFSLRKQYAYGKNVFEVYMQAVSGSGRIISTQKNIRWFNEQDTIKLKARLFDNSDDKYQAGSYSMKYIPTDFAEKIFSTVFVLLKSIDFVNNDIVLQPLDFTVSLDMLEEIRLRDVMLLLNDCIGYNNGFVIRPRLEDRQYSRVYSIFTSISSDTRKALGFYNYDIGAALQTICLQLVKDPSLYPLHQELVNNKRVFRAKIADETDKDIDWVKQELSKANNLENIPKRYDQYPILKAYCQEGLLLRKEIIRSAEPLILTRATDFAKIKWKKEWIKGKKEPEFVPDGKKESSIFFFIWTQWERLIRESMMSCFDDPSACHQVHDAVYSRQILAPVTIEKKVLLDTGFKVQISTD